VAQLFVSSTDSFRIAEAVGRMQESGRLAHDILGRTIRNADYWGCINSADLESIVDDTASGYKPELYDFSAPESVQFDIADGTNGRVNGTAVLQLKGSRSLGVSTNNMIPSSDEIPVTSLTSGVFGPGGLALLTNCNSGVVFQLSGVDLANSELELKASGGAVPGNFTNAGSCTNGSSLSNCFPDTYNEGDIFASFSEIYYIYEDNGGRRALVYEGVGGGGPVARRELVSDVRDMQVQVGTGPQGDHIINNWQTLTNGNLAAVNDSSVSYVKAIRLSLLVRSPEDRVAGSQQSACYPSWQDCSSGDNWTPAAADDRHYYRVYTSTYSIRNRLLDAATP
jgi:type IV pilus assembly protein PilW